MPEPDHNLPNEAQRLDLLRDQLGRIRAMHYGYYDQFFRFVNLGGTWVLLLFAAALYPPLERTALLLPFVLVYIGYHSAYLLHYNLFARVFANALEERINGMIGEEILPAHRMEAVYFYPVPAPKLVTWAPRLSRPVPFIGFSTINFSLLGGMAFVASWYRAYQLIPGLIGSFPPLIAYHPLLALWSLLNLVYLLWFFLGAGPEREIDRIVREAYRLPSSEEKAH